MYNLSDLPAIEAELTEAYKADRESEDYDNLLQKYTGPATGLMYDEDSGKVEISEDWAPDEEGNILKIDEATGPATGKVLKDGVIVSA